MTLNLNVTINHDYPRTPAEICRFIEQRDGIRIDNYETAQAALSEFGTDPDEIEAFFMDVPEPIAVHDQETWLECTEGEYDDFLNYFQELQYA